MTSPGTFLVKQGLEGAAPYVSGQSENIYNLLQSLRRTTTGLASTWTGTGASESYQELQSQWDTASRNLFGDGTQSPDSILGQIAQNLARIAENWAAVEQQNMQAWRH